MKRFALFAYDIYYPNGGWFDFVTTFDTLEEAIVAGRAKAPDPNRQWFHVVDLSEGKMVADGDPAKPVATHP